MMCKVSGRIDGKRFAAQERLQNVERVGRRWENDAVRQNGNDGNTRFERRANLDPDEVVVREGSWSFCPTISDDDQKHVTAGHLLGQLSVEVHPSGETIHIEEDVLPAEPPTKILVNKTRDRLGVGTPIRNEN